MSAPSPETELVIPVSAPIKAARRTLPTSFTAAELERMILPIIRFLLPGLIPIGLSLLAAKAKAGKSWFALYLALVTATGGEFLGRHLDPGEVLYLALEDNPQRLLRRMKRLMPDKALPASLSLRTKASQLGAGLLEELAAWADAAPNPRLVIIDTLGRVMPGLGGQGEYGHVTKALAPLQEFAFERDLAILIIHHARKGDISEAEDPFDVTLGTTALNAMMDGILVLGKARLQTGKPSGVILVTGRDTEEQKIKVTFNEETGRWELADFSLLETLPSERFSVLKAVAYGHATPKDISTHLGKSPTNIQNQLKELLEMGYLIKVKTGRYELSPMARQGLGMPRESSEGREPSDEDAVLDGTKPESIGQEEDVTVGEPAHTGLAFVRF